MQRLSKFVCGVALVTILFFALGTSMASAQLGGVSVPADIAGAAQGLININQAPLDMLQSLPGIDTGLAEKIVEYRDKVPFKSVEDLKNVPGITDQIFEAVKGMITI